MTNLPDELVGENVVLSNRDKGVESSDRGQECKWIEAEQLADHAANKGRGWMRVVMTGTAAWPTTTR